MLLNCACKEGEALYSGVEEARIVSLESAGLTESGGGRERGLAWRV